MKKTKQIKKSKIMTIIVVIVALIILLTIINNIKNSKEYEIEEITRYKYFKLYEGQKYGVIDENGNILIQPAYELINIPNPVKDVFVCYNNYNEETGDYETKILNKEGKEIFTNFEQVLPLMCEESTTNIPFEKSVLKYKEKGLYGIIDFSGKKITNAIYEDIESLKFKEGSLKVKQNNKYGIINIKGKTIIDIKYDDIKSDEYFTKSKGYMEAGFIVRVRTDNGYRYGYINKYGVEILKPEYNEITRITEIMKEEPFFLVSRNGKSGIIKKDKTIIDIVYEEIEYNLPNDVFIVQKNSEQGVFSSNGQNILPIEFDYILITNNKITTKRGEGIDIYNLKGEKQYSKYDNIIETENENYIITIDENNKYGVINKNEQVLFENKYENLEYVFEDFFIATENGKVGVIDINKGTVVEFKYDIIQRIKDKNILQAIISDEELIEIYNNKMQKQVSVKTAILYTFDNYIKLLSDNNMKYLDNNGNIVSNKEALSERKLYSYESNGKWGFVDKSDKVIVNPEYDLVTEFNQYGYAGIKKNDRWGVVDESGKILVIPSYKIDWNEPDFIAKYCKLNFGYGFEHYTDELVN